MSLQKGGIGRMPQILLLVLKTALRLSLSLKGNKLLKKITAQEQKT